MEDGHGLLGDGAQLGRVGAAEADLDLAAGARPQDELSSIDLGIGKGLGEVPLDLWHHLRDRPVVLDVDQELHVGAVHLLR